MRAAFSLVFLLCLLLALGGCGSGRTGTDRALGSGSSSSGGSSSGSSSGGGVGSGPELTGILAGSILGLYYETPSFSGLTDASGTFRYRKGEEVRFTLGDVDFGSAPGAPELSLFELADSAPLTSELDLRVALEDHQRVNALDLVSNRMLLLLTLDRDQDPTNGLDLTDWNRDLADYQVDFAYDLYAFPFRRGVDSLPAIKSAFAIKYQVPLDAPLLYLYDALGIVVPVHVPIRETRDFNDDGSIEQEVRWKYNSLGLPRDIRFTLEPDNTDFWRERVVLEYDGQGRRTIMLRETDIDENGSVEYFYRSENFYNGRGFLVEVLEEDGQLEVSERRRYLFEYDDGGNNSLFTFEQDSSVGTGVDAAVDGILDTIFRVRSLYDDRGLLEVREEETDLDADGLIERRRIFEFGYNNAGRLLEQVDTLDNGETVAVDGVVDARIKVGYRYSASGRLLKEILRFDDNGDGEMDRENTYEFVYLSSGLLREQTWSFDANADGRIDSRRTFTYRYRSDALLTQVKMELDSDASGTTNASEVTDYLYNSRGQLRETVVATFNSAGERQSLLTVTRVYGANGQLLDWYREGEGFTGTTNTLLHLRWQYLPLDDGLRYLVDHYGYRQPAYTEIGITDVYLPCINYRFAEGGTLCARSWPLEWKFRWAEVWKAPGVNLGGPVVIRPGDVPEAVY
ncbi:hypothetical protein ACONUD_12025 [Microbulbifer harenosus]|uniref:YD repeat-containing protein n=1 Tax=Microbulbifer harenosus TaxID=2576840 RepID=A0ABY2UIY9_9GAMM|nr:hypothetical protein [Microbulbifer harenosus]TLM77196.1 hypothetical protein FDY93_09625 [Microbulbifer harenosus]